MKLSDKEQKELDILRKKQASHTRFMSQCEFERLQELTTKMVGDPMELECYATTDGAHTFKRITRMIEKCVHCGWERTPENYRSK